MFKVKSLINFHVQRKTIYMLDETNYFNHIESVILLHSTFLLSFLKQTNNV